MKNRATLFFLLSRLMSFFFFLWILLNNINHFLFKFHRLVMALCSSVLRRCYIYSSRSIKQWIQFPLWKIQVKRDFVFRISFMLGFPFSRCASNLPVLLFLKGEINFHFPVFAFFGLIFISLSSTILFACFAFNSVQPLLRFNTHSNGFPSKK